MPSLDRPPRRPIRALPQGPDPPTPHEESVHPRRSPMTSARSCTCRQEMWRLADVSVRESAKKLGALLCLANALPLTCGTRESTIASSARVARERGPVPGSPVSFILMLDGRPSRGTSNPGANSTAAGQVPALAVDRLHSNLGRRHDQDRCSASQGRGDLRASERGHVWPRRLRTTHIRCSSTEPAIVWAR